MGTIFHYPRSVGRDAAAPRTAMIPAAVAQLQPPLADSDGVKLHSELDLNIPIQTLNSAYEISKTKK